MTFSPALKTGNEIRKEKCIMKCISVKILRSTVGNSLYLNIITSYSSILKSENHERTHAESGYLIV